MKVEKGMDAEWLEMREEWEAAKKMYPVSSWPEKTDGIIHWKGLFFKRFISPDGRYRVICNGKRCVEQGETKPI